MMIAQATMRLLVLVFVYAVSIISSPAATIDHLQGAWGVEGIECDKIFTSSHGHPEFINYDGEELSGFIVNGRHIKTANGSCDFISSQERPDGTTYLLNCDDGIAVDKISIGVRFPDKNTLVRFDMDFPEIETIYHRCTK